MLFRENACFDFHIGLKVIDSDYNNNVLVLTIAISHLSNQQLCRDMYRDAISFCLSCLQLFRVHLTGVIKLARLY